MKYQNLFLMTGLMMGVVACGGNDDPAAQPAPYVPNDVYNVPQTPTNYNFQDSEQWMVQQLQGIYGNITTEATSHQLGLGAGTHSWETIKARLVSVADSLVASRICYAYASYTYGSVLSRIDLSCLRRNLNMSSQSGIRVRYTNDPGYAGYSLAHTIDQILNTFYGSYSYMYGHWGYGGYPYSYVPVRYNDGISVGVGYSSGGGLSIGVGASWSR